MRIPWESKWSNTRESRKLDSGELSEKSILTGAMIIFRSTYFLSFFFYYYKTRVLFNFVIWLLLFRTMLRNIGKSIRIYKLVVASSAFYRGCLSPILNWSCFVSEKWRIEERFGMFNNRIIGLRDSRARMYLLIWKPDGAKANFEFPFSLLTIAVDSIHPSIWWF